MLKSTDLAPFATRTNQSPRFIISIHQIAVISSAASSLAHFSRYDTTTLLRYFIYSHRNCKSIYIVYINFIYIIIYIKYRNTLTPTNAYYTPPKEAAKQRNSAIVKKFKKK